MITRRHTLAKLAAGSLAGPSVLRAQSPTSWTAYTYVPAATLAPAKVFQEIIARVSKETNMLVVWPESRSGCRIT